MLELKLPLFEKTDLVQDPYSLAPLFCRLRVVFGVVVVDENDPKLPWFEGNFVRFIELGLKERRFFVAAATTAAAAVLPLMILFFIMGNSMQ